MITNLTYLAAATIALITIARNVPPGALVAAAIALVTVLATLGTLTHGPDALTRVIDALVRLIHGNPSG